MNKIQIVINYFFEVLECFIVFVKILYSLIYIKYFILISFSKWTFVQFYCEFESYPL